MKVNPAMKEEMQLLHTAVNVLLKAKQATRSAATGYRRAQGHSRILWNDGDRLNQLDAALACAAQRQAAAEAEVMALWEALESSDNRAVQVLILLGQQ